MDRIEFDPDELDVAMQWHGGQGSMLYAIASTGHLARSTFERCRPRHEACGECKVCKVGGEHHCKARTPYSNDEWLAHLASKLEAEAEQCERYAIADGMHDDAIALAGIAAKCREALKTLDGGIV